MKIRESGMPDEATWSSFFDPEDALRKLSLGSDCRSVVEFGCGYGTFTVAAAKAITGTVYGLDIDPGMVAATQRKAAAEGLHNVRLAVRDFVAAGAGMAAESADYVMLFNILHLEQPLVLLREAWRILRPQGLLAVMHWNYDPSTPRGPSMDIRPKPENCRDWAIEAGFRMLPPGVIDLPPYHYGMVLKKPHSR